MSNNTALLIIDIQNDYFPGGANPLEGSIEASLNAKKLLEYFRLKNMPIVHIQHFNIRSGATFLIPRTEGIEFHKHVLPSEGERIIKKNFPNSFRKTELLEYLKELYITDLVICGMMTHMCVDTTVRAAKDLGFNCTLIGDACATKELSYMDQKIAAKDVHYSFLAALSYFFADVVETEKYLTSIH
jgi:nicotinamidase-related amidase